MTIKKRVLSTPARLCTWVFGAALLATAAVSAQAQAAYPAKPIRLIVPFPPGGGTDMIARSVAQKITEKTSWNIVVDNRPGAGGNLGVDAAAKSMPDGYTLVMGQTSNLAINPALYKKLPYDPLKDLVPVALVSSSPILMVSGAGTTFKSMAEVLKLAKAKPDVVTVGYAGNGTVAHLATELFQKEASVKMTHVPYKGAAQGLTDVIGGQVDLAFDTAGSVLPMARNGRVRILGVASLKRLPQAPEIPTLAEQGLPGFETGSFQGVIGAAGMPRDASPYRLAAAQPFVFELAPDAARELDGLITTWSTDLRGLTKGITRMRTTSLIRRCRQAEAAL